MAINISPIDRSATTVGSERRIDFPRLCPMKLRNSPPALRSSENSISQQKTRSNPGHPYPLADDATA